MYLLLTLSFGFGFAAFFFDAFVFFVVFNAVFFFDGAGAGGATAATAGCMSGDVLEAALSMSSFMMIAPIRTALEGISFFFFPLLGREVFFL